MLLIQKVRLTIQYLKVVVVINNNHEIPDEPMTGKTVAKTKKVIAAKAKLR